MWEVLLVWDVLEDFVGNTWIRGIVSFKVFSVIEPWKPLHEFITILDDEASWKT